MIRRIWVVTALGAEWEWASDDELYGYEPRVFASRAECRDAKRELDNDPDPGDWGGSPAPRYVCKAYSIEEARSLPDVMHARMSGRAAKLLGVEANLPVDS